MRVFAAEDTWLGRESESSRGKSRFRREGWRFRPAPRFRTMPSQDVRKPSLLVPDHLEFGPGYGVAKVPPGGASTITSGPPPLSVARRGFFRVPRPAHRVPLSSPRSALGHRSNPSPVFPGPAPGPRGRRQGSESMHPTIPRRAEPVGRWKPPERSAAPFSPSHSSDQLTDRPRKGDTYPRFRLSRPSHQLSRIAAKPGLVYEPARTSTSALRPPKAILRGGPPRSPPAPRQRSAPCPRSRPPRFTPVPSSSGCSAGGRRSSQGPEPSLVEAPVSGASPAGALPSPWRRPGIGCLHRRLPSMRRRKGPPSSGVRSWSEGGVGLTKGPAGIRGPGLPAVSPSSFDSRANLTLPCLRAKAGYLRAPCAR